MKNFLVIGSGTFAHHLVHELYKEKCEIMLVSVHEEKMNDLLPYVAAARIANCTDPEVLATFDIPSFDVCFVCVGTSFQDSLEITSLLKGMGAQKVFSCAGEDVQAKFLIKVGADRVIFPEKEVARGIAVSESSDSIFECIPMEDGYGIFEIEVNKNWVGKNIAELNFRRLTNLTILGIKSEGKLHPNPNKEHVFMEDEHVLVLGLYEDVKKVIIR